MKKLIISLFGLVCFSVNGQINLATTLRQDTITKVLRQIRACVCSSTSSPGGGTVTVANPSVTVLNPTFTVANPSVTVLNPSVTILNQSVTVLNPSVTISGTANVNVVNTVTVAPHSVTISNSPSVTVLNPSVTILNPSVSIVNTVTVAAHSVSVVNSVSLATNAQLTLANGLLGILPGVQFASAYTTTLITSATSAGLETDVGTWLLSGALEKVKFMSYSSTAYWNGITSIKEYSCLIFYTP